jgi:NitT/TauT family transport system permease protein
MDANPLTAAVPAGGLPSDRAGGPASGTLRRRAPQKRRTQSLVSLLPLLTLAALCAIWGAAARLGPWSATVLPGPGTVLASGWALLSSGALLKHTVASLFRVTVGYYLALVLGLPLGVLLGQWANGQKAFNSLIQFLRPISPLAWIPLAMLWFGIGDKPAVFLIFLASFFPILVATIAAVRRVDATYLRVADNFGLSRREKLTTVIVPAILPGLLPALRISLGVAWLVVVAAEMIAVKSGLGYLILDARNGLRMDFVIAAMITIGAIGVALDHLVSLLGRLKAVSWGLV